MGEESGLEVLHFHRTKHFIFGPDRSCPWERLYYLLHRMRVEVAVR